MSVELIDTPCFCARVWCANIAAHANYDNSSELVKIVANNNLSALKELINKLAGSRLKIADFNGHTPLHLAILLNKKCVFDYLLTKENVDLNARNCVDLTPLHLAVKMEAEYYVKELLKKGVQVNTKDIGGCTPLHLASYNFIPHIWKILYENGADINATNDVLKTPLFHACEATNRANIEMLLYYGADANFANIHDFLPLTMAIATIPHSDIIETLYKFTIIEELPLNLLIVVLKQQSPLFNEIINQATKVKYTRNDLIDFCNVIVGIEISTIVKICNKFGYIFTTIFNNPLYACHFILRELVELKDIERLMNLLTVFIESDPSQNFFQNFEYSTVIVNHLFLLNRNCFLSKDSLEQFLYFLYSYGFPCESNHLLALYERFGFCKLFKFLLEFRVEGFCPAGNPPLMACFILHPHVSFNDILNNHHPFFGDQALFKFFSNKSVKKFFLGWDYFEKFIKNAPAIPSLVELARDVARNHIIRTLNITESYQFYRFIKKLPIAEICKKILTYEMPIYAIPSVMPFEFC